MNYYINKYHIVNGYDYTHIDDEYSINITDYVQETFDFHAFFLDIIANTKIFYRRSKSHSVFYVLKGGGFLIFFYF